MMAGLQAVRWIIAGVALLLLVPGLGACSGGRTLEWKQEVKLHDGRVILVDRISKQTGKLTPEGAILEYEQTLTFTHPDTGQRLIWMLPKGTGVRMLDFERGVPYFVLTAKSITDYNDWGCPNPPWIVYRLEQGEWLRVGVEQLPVRFIRPNMLLAARTDERASGDGLVTVQEMEAYLKRVDPPFRIFSREKVNPIAKGCYPDTLNQQGRGAEMKIGYEQEEMKK
jgi:hypothetical protein